MICADRAGQSGVRRCGYLATLRREHWEELTSEVDRMRAEHAEQIAAAEQCPAEQIRAAQTEHREELATLRERV